MTVMNNDDRNNYNNNFSVLRPRKLSKITQSPISIEPKRLERIICRLNSHVFDYGDLKNLGHDFHWKGNNLGSEDVWLGYQPCSQLWLYQFNDPNDWNHIEISFEAAHRFSSSASNVVKKCGVCLLYGEDLEEIHPQNKIQLQSRGHIVVERGSDRAGLNGSGMGPSSSGSSHGPTNNPTLSSSANVLKNDYHQPGSLSQ